LWLETLQANQFRNLDSEPIGLRPGMNLFFGPNGQGKTNALEAIYFLLTTKSFRTHLLQECVAFSHRDFEIAGRLHRNQLNWNLRVQYDGKQTQRMVDGDKRSTLDYLKMGGIMLFSSASRQILEGAPDLRRRFLDQMIALLNSDYLIQLSSYRRHYSHIKKLIHQPHCEPGVYYSFKKTLLPFALNLVRARLRFFEELSPLISSLYRELFSETEDLKLSYTVKGMSGKSTSASDYEESYSQRFLDLAPRELLYHRTAMGPHLDDMSILLDEHVAKRFSSSGQMRSFMLSILFAVRMQYKEKNGCFPLLLLDDIDSELDERRFMSILEYLQGIGQVLISSTNYDRIRSSGQVFGLNVQNGKIDPFGADE